MGGAGPETVGGQGGTSAGAGGTDATLAGGAGGDGGASGDTAGMSGAGGAVNEPPVDELAIVTLAGSSNGACTGADLSPAWRASGGEGPYTWRLAEAPPGVQPSEATGAEFRVTGVPTESGTLLVELADSTGNTVQADALVVYESPQITDVDLPPICSGKAYAVSLVARGGQPDEYVWSGELLTDEGLGAPLDALGLAIEGATLAGDFSASESGAPFEVALSVHDAHCSSEAVLELDVVSADSDECPEIQIVNAPFDDALPPPCRGNAYTEALTAEGGEGPYHWRGVSLPPGLNFDAESATLYGVAEGDGAFVVELTDQRRTIQKRYDVQTRGKCWAA